MKIRANEAKRLTEIANRPVDAWEKLFEKIKKKAEEGCSSVIFDEEIEKAWFKETRKEVKKTLEDMGYAVEYRRILNSDSDWDNDYHNEYCVSWWKEDSAESEEDNKTETDSNRTTLLYNAIHALDALKKAYPETKIAVETPSGCLELKIGEALIFEGCDGELAVDSE